MNNELFLYWKCGEPGLWTRGPGRARSMVDRSPWPTTGAWPWAALGAGDCTDSRGKMEGRPGMLTGGEVRWWGEPIEPAMGQCGGGGRCAMRAVLGAQTR